MSQEQRWYAARLVMEAVLPSRSADTLFEEKIVLVRASSEEDAHARAERHGRSSEHTYDTADGETVQWVFREIIDLKELLDDTIDDGTEVYYGFLRAPDLEHVRRSLSSTDDTAVASARA